MLDKDIVKIDENIYEEISNSLVYFVNPDLRRFFSGLNITNQWRPKMVIVGRTFGYLPEKEVPGAEMSCMWVAPEDLYYWHAKKKLQPISENDIIQFKRMRDMGRVDLLSNILLGYNLTGTEWVFYIHRKDKKRLSRDETKFIKEVYLIKDDVESD